MNSTIIHTGILGMRWGIRRFRNKDGSLTPEGKKRYAKNESNFSDDYRKMEEITSKPISSLTNAELRSANERLNLERTYKQLMADKSTHGSAIQIGRQAVSDLNLVLSLVSNSQKVVGLAKDGIRFLRKN